MLIKVNIISWTRAKMVHLIIGIKVSYIDKRSIVLAAEIIVKATLAIISALQDCTIQHYFFH